MRRRCLSPDRLHRLTPFLFAIGLMLLPPSAQAAKALWYLGQKIPDVTRPWQSADYRQVTEALKTIDEKQADALPRRGGEYTGAVFERLINEENFRPQLDIYQSLDFRREEASRILFSLKEIMRLYFDFSASRQPYGKEALSLMSYSIRQQAVLFDLTVEFWLTLSEKDQQSQERLEGLNDTKAAAAMLASSALDYLNLHQQFEQEALILYSYELGQTWPELFVHLPKAERERLLTKVIQLSESHDLDEVQKTLSELLPVLTKIHEGIG